MNHLIHYVRDVMKETPKKPPLSKNCPAVEFRLKYHPHLLSYCSRVQKVENITRLLWLDFGSSFFCMSFIYNKWGSNPSQFVHNSYLDYLRLWNIVCCFLASETIKKLNVSAYWLIRMFAVFMMRPSLKHETIGKEQCMFCLITDKKAFS